MNIVVPESVESFIQERIAQGGYRDASDYVRDLILADQERERVDQLLLEGLRSGPAVEATPAFWEERKRKVAGTDVP
jgi:antitoxin ParD1/3/4